MTTQVDQVERFISQTGRRHVLVLGAADTGKSYLVDALAERLADRGSAVAVIDADPGQSRIGPPTTVGLQQPRRPDAGADAFSFVGSISPSGHLLPMLCGVVRMAEEAERLGGELIVIDTPGFVDGPAAEALWRGMIDVLRPAVVLVWRGDSGSGRWLAGVGPMLEIAAHEAVVLRGSAQRRAYRAEAWGRYFGGASERVVDADRVAVWQMGGAKRPLTPGQLVSLRDAEGADMALGVALSGAVGELRFCAPITGEPRIASLVGGRVRLDRTTWHEQPLW
ncbi:MAG TPA: Clp1/GlmU family protein [Phycisphaerae bacterium]|nr:Clp1/GlmU family protein [Phycisphaerae bacterium]